MRVFLVVLLCALTGTLGGCATGVAICAGAFVQLNKDMRLATVQTSVTLPPAPVAPPVNTEYVAPTAHTVPQLSLLLDMDPFAVPKPKVVDTPPLENTVIHQKGMPMAGSVATHETPEKTRKVLLYFGKAKEQQACPQVRYVARDMSGDAPTLMQSAIAELLKGPTDQEKAKGFISLFHPDSLFCEVRIKRNGVVQVRCPEDKLQPSEDSPCKRQRLNLSITSTILQFDGVKKVQIYRVKKTPGNS